MLARVRPRLTYANVVASLALFVALGGGAYAARRFVGSDGRIHACVGKKGHLTLVKPGSKCGKGTSHLAWNKRGPSGRQGPGLKQFEFNSIPTDGKTYPMAPPVAGLQVRARCDASMLYIDLDTASGQTMHISGIVEHDNDTSADNPVGTITPPAEFGATSYGGFTGIAESSQFSKWTAFSVWGGHYSDHCRFWGTITPPS